MAPKAIIESVDQIGPSTLDVRGTFTDEVSFKVPFSIQMGAQSDEGVRARLKGEYDAAVAQKFLKSSLKAGAVLDLTPPVVVPPEPSPEEAARNAFSSLVQRYRRARKLTTEGIISKDDPDKLLLEVNAALQSDSTLEVGTF